MSYQQIYDECLVAKKAADKALAVAKLRLELDKVLCMARLLSPAKRKDVVDNLNVGYLIHGHIDIHDWSALADGTQADIDKLKEIGNRFVDRVMKLDK